MAKKKQETLVLFPDLVSATEVLSDEQLGALMRGIFTYRFAETEPEFDDPMVNISFRFVKPQLDRYMEICEINRNNRKKKNTEIVEVITEENESQRNATDDNETEGKATHTHTHTQNQNQNHTHTQSHTHTQNHRESMAGKPPTKNIPPTVEEVKQYCSAKGIGIDAQRFVDYYTANGWMVGKTKMKDWTAAIRMWHRKETPNETTEHKPLWTVGTVL